jgi:Fe-S oxidoreductase
MKKYPGRSFEVLHFTQLLHELVQRGKLALSSVRYKATYHDPCFLGRYNKVYFGAQKSLAKHSGAEARGDEEEQGKRPLLRWRERELRLRPPPRP